MPAEESSDPMRGAEYYHPDGTREVVFLVAEGRVLSVREYGSVSAFHDHVDSAAYRGVNQEVADLPDVEFFEAQDGNEDH